MLQVDYDSYLFVDNLKDFLRPLNPNEELYLGHNVYQHVPKGGPVFNQGGATVFSHATMNTMGKKFQVQRLLACELKPRRNLSSCSAPK